MSVIKVDGLTRDYGGQKGVFDVSFHVDQGEAFGFLGPNGAGKTTTIRHLMGFLKPKAGSCTIDGLDCWHEREQVQARLGYIPGEISFFEDMSGTEFLKFIAEYRRIGSLNRRDELLERFALDPKGRIKKMSKGMKQKLGIVAAFMHDPDILILDEPTSGLDPLMQKAFFEILRERHEKGTTVFLSSHILSEIQHNCSRAAIIREGRILVCDSVEALSQSNARRVTVHGSVELAGLPGVRDRKESEGGISFLYSGEMKALLRMLAAGDVSDLSVSEPDLEEIFMHYYEK